MTAWTEHEHPNSSSLPAAISNAVVQLLHEYTGRGPTKARNTIRDNFVLVILEQTLTKGERSLAEIWPQRQGDRDPPRIPRGDARGEQRQDRLPGPTTRGLKAPLALRRPHARTRRVSTIFIRRGARPGACALHSS